MQDEQETLKRDRRPAGVAPARAVTTGMVGRGFYNRHSAPQMAVIGSRTEYPHSVLPIEWGTLQKEAAEAAPARAISPRPQRQSAASTADMQLLELFLQQGDRVLRVLQIRDKVGRGATDITRDVRIFHNRFVEIDNDGVNQG